MWPEELREILEYYYGIQENTCGKILTLEQKEKLVRSLISAYTNLTKEDRRDVLVPAQGKFVKDHAIRADLVSSGKYIYEINYNWPPDDGFQGPSYPVSLMPGEEYDRIGSARGVFIAPISADGEIVSFLERALPYHIPESNICDNPSYHRYRVVSIYKGETSTREKSVLRGKISQAFWRDPDDGGGEQIRLPKRIRELGDVLYET